MKLNKIIPIVLIPLVVIVCVFIVCNIQDRLCFSITAFDLPQSNSFTIDDSHKGMLEENMIVNYTDNYYSYKINNTDSCLYYKFV